MTLIAGIVISALMWLGAVSARAATTMSCAFEGTIEVTGVPLIGGAGGYALHTNGQTAACAGAQQTTPFTDLYTIISNGIYANAVCGALGRFESFDSTNMISAESTPTPEPDVTSADYEIQFIAGQGELVINSMSFTGDATPAQGAGWVAMVPTAPLPPALACSPDTPMQFEVAGFFTVVG